MPDRFAIGSERLMLDGYFRTYRWMLDSSSWSSYSPDVVRPCVRRGHMEYAVWPDGSYKGMGFTGKIWPCPEHSARGLAYQGPENVLEAHLLSLGVAVRLRRDICFNHLASGCGQVQDASCLSKPVRHKRGFWMNDWAASQIKGERFLPYTRKQFGTRGSEKLETGLLQYDGIFAARLAEFLMAEWGGESQVVELGGGRGALAVSVDGTCVVELVLGPHGLCADLTLRKGIEAQSLASCQPSADAGDNPRHAEAAVWQHPDLEMDPSFLTSWAMDKWNTDRTKAWCQWLGGLESADWALALNVVTDLPRFLVPRLVAALQRHGRAGVVVSWSGHARSPRVRDLLRGLAAAGFVVDMAASKALQHFGGLLCCPWHRSTTVLRRVREAIVSPTVCQATAVRPLEDSRPCIFGQNFGCIPGGLWVHFGCGGAFLPSKGWAYGPATPCQSTAGQYAECAWLPPASPQPKRPRAPLRQALRASVELPGYLFDAMDPLTTDSGVVWAGDRAVMAAVLRAFKLSALGVLARGAVNGYTDDNNNNNNNNNNKKSKNNNNNTTNNNKNNNGQRQLRLELGLWGNDWPRLRLLLQPLASRLCQILVSGDAEVKQDRELQLFALLLSVLRAVGENANVGSRTPDRQSDALAKSAGSLPASLHLDQPSSLSILRAWDKAAQQVLPLTARPVWFEPGAEAGSGWHARFHSGQPLARYLYRFSYQAFVP
ncbi:unnamed protein product [Polarella glacialis]|uniref:Uncharacterized protein n=1 Tax=Polarella glacialis TaxID=89957 RepID=A0A813ED54_POLGL|nr:unnamed protein product [Polarella glacialis]